MIWIAFFWLLLARNSKMREDARIAYLGPIAPYSKAAIGTTSLGAAHYLVIGTVHQAEKPVMGEFGLKFAINMGGNWNLALRADGASIFQSGLDERRCLA